MQSKTALSIVFSLLVYAVIFLYFGPREVWGNLVSIPLFYVFLIILLVCTSLAVEFIRWEFYLRQLNIRLKIGLSLRIFLAGNALDFLPSKSGELLRVVMLKKHKVTLKKAMSVYLISNLTTFFVVLIFAEPVLVLYNYHFLSLMVLTLTIGLFFSLRFPIIYIYPITLVKRIINIRLFDELITFFRESKSLVTFKNLLYSFSLTVILYGLLLFVMHLVAMSFSVQLPSFYLFSVYSLLLIAGRLSMLPGGLGVVEGGFVGILWNQVDPSIAVAIVLLMRVFVHWLPTLMGIFAVNLEYLK